MKRIGILTSGGDAPGMNAAIRATVRTASAAGLETVGYFDGYQGMVDAKTVVLDDRAVGNIIHRGGTIIGTSRCPAFHQPGVRAEVAQRMRAEQVEALVVIGGDGSFRGALALQDEQGLTVAGVPGTIDNDVWGTEETIGFDTAVNTALRAIDALRDTGEATGTTFFVEVMGRSAGAIAIHTGLGGGATGILVAEAPADLTGVIQLLQASVAAGKRSHIVIVSEGEEAGGAIAIARAVEAAFDFPHRVVVLGHVQRGGAPTARDRMIATVSGAAAVDGLVAGRSGFMVGIQGGRPVEVPLAEVVAGAHPEARFDLLHLAQRLAR